MLIPCPWCGLRNQIEFTYGGDATLPRPPPDATEREWTDYVYFRDNPCGPHDELWYHGACQAWLVVTRDTRNHEIFGVESLKSRTLGIGTGGHYDGMPGVP